MNLLLTRIGYLEHCTLGWLDCDGLRLATIERPWIPGSGRGGKPRVSCIPDGLYTVRTHDSARFPGTYALINEAHGVYYQPGDIPSGQAWGRSAILIHQGNRVADVIGCIAVGLKHGYIGGENGVHSSAVALTQLRTALGRNGTHQLNIVPTHGAIDS